MTNVEVLRRNFDLRYSLLIGVPSKAGFNIRYSAAGSGKNDFDANPFCAK
ncbi:MAG: hypothetical protein NTV22_19875 [bacterium]|nr:hypothetical protein [bacterium]